MYVEFQERLRACGVIEGDEVMLQTLAPKELANAVIALGAVPVFVDSEPHTGCMYAEQLRNALCSRFAETGKMAKAIVPVSLEKEYNKEYIGQVAHRYEIPVVEYTLEPNEVPELLHKLPGFSAYHSFLNGAAEEIYDTMKATAVLTVAWLTTQQVLVTTDEKGVNIKGHGSGFFFQYRERLFFVTADHVSHMDDFEAGIRLGEDDYVSVFNNKNSSTEFATMTTPIGGLFSFDEFDLLDELSIEIPDMKDISFAILPDTFQYPFLTHELTVNGVEIIPAGKLKRTITSDCVTEPSNDDIYLVAGCVCWNLVNGVRLDRKNAIHAKLKLRNIDKEGNYILKYPVPVVYVDWAGLSGAPVFNNDRRLIGMLTGVNDKDDTVCVMPMKRITHLMDCAIQYENTMK